MAYLQMSALFQAGVVSVYQGFPISAHGMSAYKVRPNDVHITSNRLLVSDDINWIGVCVISSVQSANVDTKAKRTCCRWGCYQLDCICLEPNPWRACKARVTVLGVCVCVTFSATACITMFKDRY